MDIISFDAFHLVFLELPVFSLGCIAQVSTKWYNLLNAERNDSLLWESYYMKYFGGTKRCENWRFSIKSGVNVLNLAKRDFSSALRSAVCQRMDKLTNTLLLQKNIDLSDPLVAKAQRYPLHLATGFGDEATITVLLNHRCDPNLLNHQGKTSKKIAAEKANLGALLLVAPESALNDPNLFLSAIKLGKTNICLELIKLGVDVNFSGSSDKAIHLAAHNGIKPLIVEFLKKGTPVDVKNSSGITALQVAAQMGRTSIVRYLLKMGADPNYKLKTSQLNAFLFATKSTTPKQEILELLLKVTVEGVASTDRAKRTAIHNLATHPTFENAQLIKWLVENYDAQVNICDGKRKTPLQICISNLKPGGSLDMVETLISMRGDINDGLDEAVKYNRVELVNHLIQMGASVLDPNRNGIPPLFTALEKNYKNMIDLLLRSGADMYAVLPNGWTALNSLAASRYYYYDKYVSLAKQIVDVLRIDFTQPESDPHHVLDQALMSGQDTSIVYFLIQTGAKVHNMDILQNFYSNKILAVLFQSKACPLPDNHLFAVLNYVEPGVMAMLLWYLGADPGYCSKDHQNMTIFEYVHHHQLTQLEEELMKASQDPEYPFLFLRNNSLLLSQLDLTSH